MKTPRPVKRPDLTRAAVAERRERIRQLAAAGHSSKQIAAELRLSLGGLRNMLTKMGSLRIPADEVLRGAHRHDPARIIASIVMDAEHLTSDTALIDFSALDPAALPGWITALRTSHRALGEFIRRLRKEYEQHEHEHHHQTETHAHTLESTPRADQCDAYASGARDATPDEEVFCHVARAKHGFE